MEGFKCQIEEFVPNSMKHLLATGYSMNWRPDDFFKVKAWDEKEEVNTRGI